MKMMAPMLKTNDASRQMLRSAFLSNQPDVGSEAPHATQVLEAKA
jgi:hypothetical protein